jgi:hypothetical protein
VISIRQIFANPVPVIAWCAMMVGPPAILAWVVRDWWRASPKIEAPAWRSYLAIAAIGLVGLSQMSRFVIGIRAEVSGLENPVLLWLLGIGFLTAPIALLVSVLGKGTLRRPACGLAVITTFTWILSTPWDM